MIWTHFPFFLVYASDAVNCSPWKLCYNPSADVLEITLWCLLILSSIGPRVKGCCTTRNFAKYLNLYCMLQFSFIVILCHYYFATEQHLSKACLYGTFYATFSLFKKSCACKLMLMVSTMVTREILYTRCWSCFVMCCLCMLGTCSLSYILYLYNSLNWES